MHPARRSQVVTYLLVFFFSTIAAFIPRSTGTLSIPEIRGRTKMSSISEKDKYLFDLNGYIVIREVLTPPEIETCNRAIDTKQDLARERREDELRNTKKDTPLAGDGLSGRKDLGGILEWGEDSQVFRNMLAHPRLIPYFHEFLGKGYRMDHLPFLLIQDQGSEGFALHGGTVDCVTGEYNPNLAYSCVNGKISNHLLAMSVVLSDHNEGDGGFCVVRGSHKSNFAAPQDMIDGIDSEFLYQPVTKAGDVILFSEGTVHGAKAWNAEHQRRVALYRFSPATVAYGRSYYPSWPESILDGLSATQRNVLQPPFANRLDRHLLSENGDDIEISSRSAAKKSFDREVFGTQYF